MKKNNLYIIVSLLFITVLNVYSQSWTNAGFVSNPGVRPSISINSLNNVWIADGAVDTPKVFRTTNGGINWSSVPVNGITKELYCIWSFDGDNAVVGEGVVSGNARLFKTTNGGLNWSVIFQTGNNRGFFNGLVFTKTDNGLFGLAIAERIYRSSNNGINWVELNPGSNGVSNAQNSLFIIDDLFYGYGMNNGAARIKMTTDNSASWLTQNINISGNYTSTIAYSTDKLKGLSATSTSLPLISRTTDGGLTWSNVNVGTGISGVCFIQWIPYTPIVYILGSNGTIKRSTDNGLTWVLTPTPPGVTNITHFDFYRYTTNLIFGYAVSSNGNVIKLADSTLIIITSNQNNNKNIPDKFGLSQNYPNPFNPVTKIDYTVPQNSLITIKVFDIIGNEIATLVNENKKTGTYDITFDGSLYSSGVYYYKMNTSTGFTQTKKMILVK
jgi:photosystem II stability/assembly factor-like uncharacterized protein